MLRLLNMMIISMLNPGMNGEYICNTDNLTNVTSVRKPLPTSAYPEECSRSVAYPNCRRSPCQNLLQCRCTHPTTGKSPPGVNCWKPGRKIATDDGKCRSDIPVGVAVTNFNDGGRFIAGTCGVFMGCVDEKSFLLFDQTCFKDLGSRNFNAGKTFYTIEGMDILEAPVGSQIDCVDQPSSVNNCSLNTGICQP